MGVADGVGGWQESGVNPAGATYLCSNKLGTLNNRLTGFILHVFCRLLKDVDEDGLCIP